MWVVWCISTEINKHVANGACNMTTAVALEHNIYREFLGISGVNVRMYSSTRDSCHASSANRVVYRYRIKLDRWPCHVTVSDEQACFYRVKCCRTLRNICFAMKLT